MAKFVWKSLKYLKLGYVLDLVVLLWPDMVLHVENLVTLWLQLTNADVVGDAANENVGDSFVPVIRVNGVTLQLQL